MSCRNSILIPFIIILAYLTLGEQTDCVHKPRGGSITLKLEYKGQGKPNHVIWKKDGETIYERKKENVITGRNMDISSEGFLQLKDLKATHAGEYEAEAFGSDGKSIKTEAKKICITEPVTKPTVHLNCTIATAKLTCKVEPKSTNLIFSWQENKIEMPGKTSSIIEFNPKQRERKKYSCSVDNGVNKETSKEIENNCEGEYSTDEVTFLGTGFGFWIEIAMLATGGTLLVILVVVVVVCICKRRQHKHKLHRDEEEFRLTNLTHGQQPHPPGHHCHQAPPQKTHAGQCGHPHSDDHPPALPKPRGQNRPRPPQPAGPAHDEEHPPPRPKPRKGPRQPRSGAT